MDRRDARHSAGNGQSAGMRERGQDQEGGFGVGSVEDRVGRGKKEEEIDDENDLAMIGDILRSRPSFRTPTDQMM